ncbi:MAG: DUF4147 domain-containing protein [bacterium]|nr:DUF4147 domain-containing protein [bacterium]
MEHRIQNFETLATNDMRRDALAIAEAGYAAVDVGAALARTLRIEGETLRVGDTTYPLAGRKVYFVGVGKCANTAARAVEQLLGDLLTSGIALDVSPLEEGTLTKIEALIGTHPLPSEVNVQATKRIMEFLSDLHENDLVIMLISGGGSTLLCLHGSSMTCLDESVLFADLTGKGASIQEINIVRKHISRARGGALAAAAYPAEVVSLIVSDVPGNNIEFISSGPTVLDSSTVDDARAVINKYGIVASENIEFIETPKEEKYFKRINNVLLLSNKDALSAMKDEAVRLGYSVTIEDDDFAGEASEIGRKIVEKLHTSAAKSALVYAGESTVAFGKNSGVGGRNQEMALSVLEYLNDGELILPFASDGRDNTNHAGAIADAVTLEHTREKNLSVEEHLSAHSSYDFFKFSGDALITGYTGSNVSDLIIALKK